MGLFKAPEGVTSVSVAGVELEVKDGFVETDENIWPFVEPLGFTVGKPDDLVALREAAAKAAEAAEAAAAANASALAEADAEKAKGKKA